MRTRSAFSPVAISVVLWTICLIPFAAHASAAPGAGPTDTLKTKNGEVDKLLRLKVQPESAAEKKQKADIATLAGQLFDYPELIKRAMGDHWAQITPAQQADLVGTMRALIERRYVKQLKGNLDYSVVYKDEKLTGQDAVVQSMVKVKTKGKSTDAEIVYKLRQVDDRWVVWDVVTDESSLMRTYKGDFHRIITQSGFPELLRKMKAKLAEKDKD